MGGTSVEGHMSAEGGGISQEGFDFSPYLADGQQGRVASMGDEKKRSRQARTTSSSNTNWRLFFKGSEATRIQTALNSRRLRTCSGLCLRRSSEVVGQQDSSAVLCAVLGCAMEGPTA